MIRRRHTHVWLGRVLAICSIALTALVALSPASRGAAVASGFHEETVFTGLTQPTAIRFASDGRVFVAEKSGLVKVFDNLADPSPTDFADLRTNVYNYWDRGLLGLALDPSFPTRPYVYVLYTYDHMLGSTAEPPRWGTPGGTTDSCPTPPGPTTDGCVVSGRLSRLTAAGDVMTGTEKVLIEDWCQQFPSHSIGSLAFGPGGALYVTGGDGASFNFTDWGQAGSPRNPCGDPPAGVGGTMTPPTAEGGALRSQDLRTSGDPVTLDGAVLRVDPDTGDGLPTNPLAGNPDPNARRIIAYGLRNPFRMTVRPGTSEIWIGDVGLGTWEEIDRIPDPTDAVVENFGWPCYEARSRPAGYDGADLNICESLYTESGADTAPYFTYRHDSQVVPGDNCPVGGSSIAGVAFSFYGGGPYPADYDGALFFADYSRDCIWVMKKDASNLPAPGLLSPFVAPAANPVDLQVSPAGELFYVDFDGGTIQRIRYGDVQPPPPNPCPTGQFNSEYFVNTSLSGTATTTRCEPSPLHYNWGSGGPDTGVGTDNFSARWTGNFDFPAGEQTFTATSDDGVRLWVDDALLIDGWRDQGPTTYTATKALASGVHSVRVEYYERGAGALISVSWAPSSGGPTTCASGQYRAEYFNNRTLSGSPAATRCEPSPITYDWGSGSPVSGVGADDFSVRWSGDFDFAGGAYTFSATSDDGVRVRVDGTLLVDAWQDQGPTMYTAATTLAAGAHAVNVEYYEHGGAALVSVSWAAGAANTQPSASIDSPAAGRTWGVGDHITFAGSGTDAEDGILPPSAFSWGLVMQHCPSNCHTHPLQTFDGVTGGAFDAPDHEYPSYLELSLTVTDSGGLSDTKTLRLDPKTVVLSFRSAPDQLQLVVGSFQKTTPFDQTVILGSNNTISAPSPQTLNGTQYVFSWWSDGGPQTHNITANAAVTYTATYTASPPPPTAPVNTALPTISGPPKEGSLVTASDGSWSGTTPITFTYQWRRCNKTGSACTDIAGATAKSYRATAADVNYTLRVQVTATNSAGSSSATSDKTAIVKRAR
jgi:glucose/arabinose dehydrogenase